MKYGYSKKKKLCNMQSLFDFILKKMFELHNLNLTKYFMFKLSPKNTTMLNLLKENFNIHCSTCNLV
jgi:hypothetical protein